MYCNKPLQVMAPTECPQVLVCLLAYLPACLPAYLRAPEPPLACCRNSFRAILSIMKDIQAD